MQFIQGQCHNTGRHHKKEKNITSRRLRNTKENDGIMFASNHWSISYKYLSCIYCKNRNQEIKPMNVIQDTWGK